MYQVYIDSVLVYDDLVPDTEYLKMVDPTLEIDINSAGTFTAKIPPTNVGYNLASPLSSTVEVYKDGAWLWTGRPLTVDEDFFGMKTIKCEGAFSFLNDIIIPFKMYDNKQVLAIVADVLSTYNNKASDNRKIYRGMIASSTEGGAPIANYDMVSDNNSAMECINEIIEHWGLFPRIRKVSGNLYLDLITTSYFNMSTQRIDFGKNLLDYAKTNDWSGIVTSIMPIGKELDTHKESGKEEYPDRVNISSVNGGSKYLTRNADKERYGLIEQKVEWNDVDDPSTLKQLAEVYLDEMQYGELSITVTVADLHYLDVNVQSFDIYTQVNCYSAPHGLDKTFVVTKMSIPFDHPENAKFEFSRSTYASMGATSSVKNYSKSMSNIAGHIPKITEFRKVARSNAAELILSATNGFVSLVQSQDGSHVEYLSITNTENLDDATRRWVWTVNGLMHQKRNSKDEPWRNEDTNIAITMDGEIVADVITTGVIRAGENYINLDTGEVVLQNAKYIEGGKTIDYVELAKSGKIEAEKATAIAIKANDKQVGSTNLLYDTATMQAWVVAGTLNGGEYDIHDFDPWDLQEGINDKTRGYNTYYFMGYSGTPIGWNVVLKSPKGKLRVYDVKSRRLTLSFYTQSNAMRAPIGNNNALFVSLCLCDENGNRKRWRDIRVNEVIPEQLEHRVKISFTMEAEYFTGGTYTGNIDALYFEVWSFPRTDAHLYFNRFKLEFGDVATEWDSNYRDLKSESERAANSAYEAARTYTNAISKKDREFTEDQSKALKESLTQREILRIITNDFKTKGFWLEKNELYINGTYIRSGTIDAGIIKAGILIDEAENNLWNLATGYFQTKNAVMINANVDGQFTTGTDYKICLEKGQIVGYGPDNKSCGYMDSTASVYDIQDGWTKKGLQIAGGVLRISTDYICVHNRNNVGQTSTTTERKKRVEWKIMEDFRANSDGSMSWNVVTHGIEVMNGLVVSVW